MKNGKNAIRISSVGAWLNHPLFQVNLLNTTMERTTGVFNDIRNPHPEVHILERAY